MAEVQGIMLGLSWGDSFRLIKVQEVGR
jgi:hypothetical protein